jgi:serine/threonine protein kinase/WD40 repeat protein/tetratricopeptide (TPR) repeat protein
MSTTTGSRDYGRFDELAEEFAERYRRGERPSLQEYVDRLPEMAEEIREMFPAMVEVEQADGEARGELAPPPLPVAPHLSQIGDYRILREIGRGGMGVVYEAEQISLGRRVALKVLPGHVTGDRKALERFRREAKSAARLHHTNIVPVFDVGRDRDVSFYAMQLIQGQGLDQVIDELRRLREPGRTASPRPPVGPRTPEATVTQARVAASTGPRKRELGWMAELLLSGRIVTEGLGSPATDSRAATGLVATERFDLDASSTGETGPTRASTPLTPWASEAPSSAVMPGGKHVSELDTSGRRQPFFKSVAQIGRQSAQGMAHAHSRGILHRDIKPSNLLLDTDGVVWITDFGLAKAEDDGLTATGDILGTLRYMAPERLRGEGDARADIYALGLTLYELLTLRPAFDSSDRLKLIEKVKNMEPVRPREIDVQIPRDLETIVLKAIDKEPERRYATADAMAEDLRRFLADEPIKARQISSSERYWRWARRNPVIATLGAVLSALLVAVTIGSLAAAAYFKDSAEREKNLARSELLANRRSQADQKVAIEARKDAVKSQRQAVVERDRSLQLSAKLALDRGLSLAEEGHADRGSFWMLEALKTAPDDAEGFRRTVRWNLGAWLGQVHKPLAIYDIGPCDDLAFSPDGRSFATAKFTTEPSRATPMDLWDTASGRKLSTFPGAFAPFFFHPEGKIVFAHSERPERVQAFEPATGRVLWTSAPLPGDESSGMTLTPDGSLFLQRRHPNPGELWHVRLDLVTGQMRGEPLRSRDRMTFAPDGRTAATVRVEEDGLSISVLDLPGSRHRASWRVERAKLASLAFRPDGKSLCVSSIIHEFDHKLAVSRLWDLEGNPASRPMPVTSYPLFFPSGDRLLVSRDFQPVVLDTATARARGSRFHGAGNQALHPDGRTLLKPAFDQNAILWQVSTDAEPMPEKEPYEEPSMSRSPASHKNRGLHSFRGGKLGADGQVAASLVENPAGRELIRLVDPTTGLTLGSPARHYPGWIVRSFAFSPDRKWFATGSHPMERTASEVRLWDTGTGRLLLPPMLHTNWASALAFHPDGRMLAAGDYHGLIRFWDTSTGKEIGRPFHQGEIILGLAYSPDGKILAAGQSNDRTGKLGVRLWDTTTSQPIGELLPNIDVVSRIEFRPDGSSFLAGNWRSTRLWDTKLGKMIGEPMVDESPGGFRPDGRAFLTLGREGSIKLRDAETGGALSTLLTASSPATCSAFRGDGGLVAAGFDDGSVRLCDPATSQPVGPPRFMSHGVRHLAFASGGLTVNAVDDEGETRTWSIPEPLQDSSLDVLTLRIEARTGLRMDTRLAISQLDAQAWQERLGRLGRLDPSAVQLDDDPAWHEPMAREAEQNGNAFAAIWHLDRLIAAHPADWFLLARRARAASLSDKFDQAAADFRQAERLGSREQVLDFQTNCVIDCSKANRWAEALWYLDRLIAARPDDGSLHEDRAAVYAKLGREDDRQADLARVFELGADEGLVMTRAEALGRAGRWAEAAGLLARRGRSSSVSRELAQAWGVASVRAGDRAAYREACAALLAWEGPKPTIVWNALSEASLLTQAPGGVDDYQALIDGFGKRLAITPPPIPVYRHLFLNALGGLLLRAGRIDEAITRVNEGMAVAKDAEGPGDWALLAIAHARRGSLGEARQWLGRLQNMRHDPRESFWDGQELAILQSEAEFALRDAAFPDDPFPAATPR